MKKLNWIFLILSIFLSSVNKTHSENYGFTYRNFEIDGEGATLLGARIDKNISEDFGIGLGLYLSSEVKLDYEDDSTVYDGVNLNFIAAYIYKKYYLSGFNNIRVVPSLFYGVGDVFVDKRYKSNDDEILEEESSFNIIEPGIGIETNITTNIYIELAGAYTMISGTDLTNYEDDDFSGFVISFTLNIKANLFSFDGFGSGNVDVPDWGKMPGE